MPFHPVHVIAVSVFLAGLAALLASVEIEAEGPFGWAEKLATWYRLSGPLSKWYYRLMNRPLTGYHAALTLFTIGIFLWPAISDGHIGVAVIAGLMAQYFAWTVAWDFGWFAMNPSYGWRSFRRDKVWWFAREPWIGPVPMTYFTAVGLSLGLAAVSGWSQGGTLNRLESQLLQWGCFVPAMLLMASLGAKAYHHYYFSMHEKDERSDAGIFYR